MPHHTLVEQLELTLPVVQAPMAGISTAEMVIAASNAGFLGSLGAGMMSPEEIEASIRQIKSETTSAFNINFFIIDADFFCGYRPLCKSFLTNIDV